MFRSLSFVLLLLVDLLRCPPAFLLSASKGETQSQEHLQRRHDEPQMRHPPTLHSHCPIEPCLVTLVMGISLRVAFTCVYRSTTMNL